MGFSGNGRETLSVVTFADQGGGFFGDLPLGGDVLPGAVVEGHNGGIAGGEDPAAAGEIRLHGLTHEEVVYIGDDYGLGGNDEAVYLSDFPYITIDNYLDFPEKIRPLL